MVVHQCILPNDLIIWNDGCMPCGGVVLGPPGCGYIAVLLLAGAVGLLSDAGIEPWLVQLMV